MVLWVGKTVAAEAISGNGSGSSEKGIRGDFAYKAYEKNSYFSTEFTGHRKIGLSGYLYGFSSANGLVN